MEGKEKDNSTQEIEITPEMREAGAAVLLGYFGGEDPTLDGGELAISVFRAMLLARGSLQDPCANRSLADK
jgi:hypothetical protein